MIPQNKNPRLRGVLCRVEDQSHGDWNSLKRLLRMLEPLGPLRLFFEWSLARNHPSLGSLAAITYRPRRNLDTPVYFIGGGAETRTPVRSTVPVPFTSFEVYDHLSNNTIELLFRGNSCYVTFMLRSGTTGV